MLTRFLAGGTAALAVASFLLWVRLEQVTAQRNDATFAATANAALLATVREQAAVSEKVLTARAATRTRIKTVTKEIIHEVVTRVPVGTCSLAPDWGLLHNAAAAGALPNAPGNPDGAASRSGNTPAGAGGSAGRTGDGGGELLPLP